MTNANANTRKRIDKRLIFIPILMVILFAMMSISVSATESWQFGSTNDTTITNLIERADSLKFKINDSGGTVSTALNKYDSNGVIINRNYCTPPQTKFKIGNDSFSSNGGWGGSALTGGSITYYVNNDTTPQPTGSATTAWDQAITQKAVVEWEVSLTGANNDRKAIIQWIVTYTRGASDFTHEWNIESKDGQPIIGGMKLYYGGHHQLGGGSSGGYRYYDGINDAIYTWGEPNNPSADIYPNNGLYMLRSEGVRSASYDSTVYNSSSGVGTYTYKITNNEPLSRDPEAGIALSTTHTIFYMHWDEPGDVTKWTVKAREGIMNSGSLAIHTQGDKNVPNDFTFVYDYTLMNLPILSNANYDILMNLKVSVEGMNGIDTSDWKVVFADSQSDETEIIMNGYNGKNGTNPQQKVRILVTVPDSAITGDQVKILLDAEIVKIDTAGQSQPYDGNSATFMVNVDTSLPAFTSVFGEVTSKKGNGSMDITVYYKNHPDNPTGGNPQLMDIYIYDSDGKGTDSQAYTDKHTNAFVKWTGYIDIGDTITIDENSVNDPSYNGGVVGIKRILDNLNTTREYYIVVENAKISDPGYAYFTVPGDISGIVWQDLNKDGQRFSTEGIAKIKVDFTDVGTKTYSVNSVAYPVQGQFNFTDKNAVHQVGGSYTVGPDLTGYAVVGIVVTVEGVSVPIDNNNWNTLPAFIELFEEFEISAAAGIVSYKFNPGMKEGMTFTIQIAPSATLAIIPYVGNVEPAKPSIDNVWSYTHSSIVNGAKITIDYTVDGETSDISGVTSGDAPLVRDVLASKETSKVITVEPPIGYRITGTTNPMKWTGSYTQLPEKAVYPIYVKMIARAVYATGATLNSVYKPVSGTPADPMTAELGLDTSWARQNVQLNFDAWNESGQIASPLSSKYKWEIRTNTQGVLTSLTANGIAIFSGKEGTVTVRIIDVDYPSIYHDMKITMTATAYDDFEYIYIADASNLTALNQIDYVALVGTGKTDVVVVGVEKGSGNKSIILNADATITLANSSIVTITPSTTNPYIFTVTGKAEGTTSFTAKFDTLVSNKVDVLVTNAPITGGEIKVKINPSTLISGMTADVTYTLLTTDGRSITLPPSMLDPVIDDPTVANFVADATTVSGFNFGQIEYKGAGDITLGASLAPTAKTALGVTGTVTPGSADVECLDYDEPIVPPAGFTFMIAENGTTGGFITAGAGLPGAQYYVFFDNGDGVYNVADDTLIPYDTLGLKYTAASTETLHGDYFGIRDATPDAKIQGSDEGIDKLIATYVYNGVTYTASVDIVVLAYDYTFSEIVVTPSPTVLQAGQTQTLIVQAKSVDSGTGVKYQTLPTSMYTSKITLGASYVTLIAKDEVKALDVTNIQKVEYTATLIATPSVGTSSGKADILVIPAGAKLAIEPKAIWIEQSKTGTASFSIVDSAGAYLADVDAKYVTRVIGSKSIATEASITSNKMTINGVAIGRTTLTGNLISQTDTASSTIYVYDSIHGIMWDPNPLNIAARATKTSTVYLADGSGNNTYTKVELDHLTISPVNNTSVANISSSAQYLLSVTAENLTVDDSTYLTATIPGTNKTARLDINVTTDARITGIEAIPNIVYLWPGEVKSVQVIEKSTGKPLDGAQLTALTRQLADTGINIVSVDTANGLLLIEQAANAPVGYNKLTLTASSGASDVVHIFNFLENPEANGNSLKLELDPNPASTYVGDSVDVCVYLNRYDASNKLIDSIELPWDTDFLSRKANTTPTTLPGNILIYDGNATTLIIEGVEAGAQTYSVTYTNGTSKLTATGKVFVFAQNPTNIDSDPAIGFQFVPLQVVLTTAPQNNSKTITGLITYTGGATQVVSPEEFPIAVPNLKSENTGVATVNSTATITASSLNGLAAAETKVVGTLIDTTLDGYTDVLVIDPNAVLAIDPNQKTIYTTPNLPVNTPISVDIKTTLSNNSYTFEVPNKYLTYKESNDNIIINNIIGNDRAKEVIGNKVGTSIITSTLTLSNTAKTTMTARADIEVKDGNIAYYDVTYHIGFPIDDPRPDTFLDNDVSSVSYKILGNPFDSSITTGYSFAGWEDQDGTLYEVGREYPLTGDLHLYAIWSDERIPYTVTYHDDGATWNDGETYHTEDTHIVLAFDDTNLTEPANKRFDGWKDDMGTSYAPGAQITITGPVNLYAQWSNMYTVTYVPGDGIGTAYYDPTQAIFGEPYAILDYTTIGFTAQQGYEFSHWEDALGNPYYASTTESAIADDTILTAMWTLIPPTTYIVTYEDGYGNSDADPVDEGNPYYAKPANTFTAPAGKKFSHWQDVETLITYDAADPINVTDHMTLVAVWEDVTHEVRYEYEDGEEIYTITAPEGPYEVGKDVIIDIPDGYELDGWDDGTTIHEDGATIQLEDDITLVPVFVKVYTVTYTASDVTEGTVPTDNKQYRTGAQAEVLGQNTLLRDGYKFLGWSVNADGSGRRYNSGDKYDIGESDVTFYAVWVSEDEPTNTIRYEYDEDNLIAEYEVSEDDETIIVGGAIDPDEDLDIPDGKKFAGWEDQDGNKYEHGAVIDNDGDKTFKPVWEDIPLTYTVTYTASDATDGTVPTDNKEYRTGDKATVLGQGTLLRDDYKFVGWSVNADGSGTKYNLGDKYDIGESDVTFYAVWVSEDEPTNTITYEYEDGTLIVEVEVPEDDPTIIVGSGVDLDKLDIPDGKELAGWKDQDGNEYEHGAVIDNDGDKTFTPVWEDITHEVTYEYEDGTVIDIITSPEGEYKVGEGIDVEIPDGYELDGWDDGTTIHEDGATIQLEDDITLVPVFAKLYTVTYDANDGEGTVPTDNGKYRTGDKAPILGYNDLSKDGYKLIGWSLNADGSGDIYRPGAEYTIDESDVTFYAAWISDEESTNTMTYTDEDGNIIAEVEVPEDEDITVGAGVDLDKLDIPEGKELAGWEDQDGNEYEHGEKIPNDEDKTFKPVWKDKTHEVTYEDEDGNVIETIIAPEGDYKVGEGVPVVVPEDSELDGWVDQDGNRYDDGEIIQLEDDMVLTPVFVKTYKVIYNANGGTGAVPVDNNKYRTGATVTVLGYGDLSRAGYTFVGWALNANGTGTIYRSGDRYVIGTSDVTFYAKWEKKDTPTVYYKLIVQTTTGGTVNSNVSGYYQAGDVIEIIATANTNYKFTGWTTTVNGVLANANSPTTRVTMPASNVTVTANFTSTSSSSVSMPIIIGGPGGTGSGSTGDGSGSTGTVADTYKVTYRPNGGDGDNYVVDGIASGAKHTVLNLEATDISRDGYIFDGWNTKANGSGTDYVPGDIITVTADVVLYAQWREKVELNTADHIVYLNGYTDGSVKPDNNITRAEAASIFYRLLEDQGTVKGGVFKDVANDAWYATAVNYLASVGIAEGYADGTFMPNQAITRAEFVAMAVKFEDIVSADDSISFSDVDESHEAYSYIMAAVANGWVSGFPDGTFRPEEGITRAQVVKIINLMLGRKIDDASLATVANPYTDLSKDHWAYADIIEASVAHEYTIDDDGNEIWE